MTRLIAVLALLAATAPVRAELALDYGKSQIRFVAKQMNVPMEGEFRKFTARVDWNAAKPDASKAEVAVDLASFDLGEPQVNDEARGKSFFNVAAFPKATFVSKAVRSLGGGRYEVVGDLAIKGIGREVTVPFAVRADGDRQVFEGTFPLRRLAYRVGEGAWEDTGTLADEVQVRVRLVTVPKK